MCWYASVLCYVRIKIISLQDFTENLTLLYYWVKKTIVTSMNVSRYMNKTNEYCERNIAIID